MKNAFSLRETQPIQQRLRGASTALVSSTTILLMLLAASSVTAQNLVLNAGDVHNVPVDSSGTDPGFNRWILRGGILNIDSGTLTTTSTTAHLIGQLNTGSVPFASS